MKKLLFLLLTVVLALSLFAVPANADAGVTVSLTVAPAEAVAGGTVTVTFTVNPGGKNIDSVSARFDLAGLNVTSVKVNDGFNQDGYNKTQNKLDLHYTGEGQGLSASFPAVVLTCTAPEGTALGSKNVKATEIEIGNAKVSGGTYITGGESSAPFKVVHAGDHKWEDTTPSKDATCQSTGTMNQKCSIDGCDATNTRTIEKKAHDWQTEPTWNWDDPMKPVATLTCKGVGCDAHSVQVTATATQSETDATCTKPGTTTYTATAKFGTGDDGNGQSYPATHEVNGVPLGHTWKEENIDWGAWSSADPEKPFDVTLKCAVCDAKLTAAGVKASKDASSTEPTCENAGSYVYTATVSFDKSQDEVEQSKDKVPQNVKYTFDPVTKDALGHDWDEDLGVEVKWTWDGEAGASKRVIELDKGTEMVAVCKHENCDGDGTLTLSYDKKDGSTDPTCTTEGKVTYVATGVTKDGKGKYTFEDEEQTLNALGHDFDDNLPGISWPTDWKTKTPPTGLKATTQCNRCDEEVEATKVEVTEGSKENIEPTYEKDGTYYWTATATFPNGKGGTVTLQDENHAYTIPKLEAEVDASASGENVGEGAQTALKKAADAMVESALKGEKPAGMPDAVFQAIQEANSSNQSLMITTELVTTPASVPSDVPGGVSAINASIKITINKTDIEDYDITEVPDAISLKFPKPATGGPIFYVMSDHGGSWSKVDSKADGDNIVFSTKQFSQFVLVGSNNLVDAEISGVEPSYTYTGKAIEPAVKVTINGNEVLEEGKDYTVEYASNDKPGTATVTIKGIGNYTGSVTKTFTILESAATAAPSAAPAATKAPSAPGTGDETPVALFAVVLTACAAVLGVVLFLVRRRQQQK